MHFPKLYCEDLPVMGMQTQTPIPLQPFKLSRSRGDSLRPNFHLLPPEGQMIFPGIEKIILRQQTAQIEQGLENVSEQTQPVHTLTHFCFDTGRRKI
jgi:hypothetical protein